MTLADALSQPPQLRKGPTCSIAVLHDSLNTADAAAFLAAVHSPSWTATALCETLQANGLQVTHEAIRRHRLRRCACKMYRPELVG